MSPRECSITSTSRRHARFRASAVYVQNLIREQGALIWRLINAGGYVYVCGSQPMRDSVRAAFVDVAGEHGSLSPEHAEAIVHQLETTENRYRPDVWG